VREAWPRVRLGEVLTQDRQYVFEPEPRLYRKLSVKLYGRGVVVDAPADGAALRMRRHQLAKTGQVILSEIWGKKGAIGFVPPERTSTSRCDSRRAFASGGSAADSHRRASPSFCARANRALPRWRRAIPRCHLTSSSGRSWCLVRPVWNCRGSSQLAHALRPHSGGFMDAYESHALSRH